VSQRLFLALEPSDDVCNEAERAERHLAEALPALPARYVPPSSIHLTLAFLGQVELAHLAGVERAIAGVARTARPLRCVTAGLGAFPAARRPSVLWLGLDQDGTALSRLQHDLTRALGTVLEREDPERFVPHLTLARVSGLGRTPRDALATALETFPAGRVAWRVDELVLFRSDLGSAGARHTPLSRLPLAAPAGTAGG
jgi:2'-5' RNA ligase